MARSLVLAALALLAAAVAAPSAPAPFPKARPERAPNEAELARLQGTWETVDYNDAGVPIGNPRYQVVFGGSRMTFRSVVQEYSSTWTVTLDVRTRTLLQTRDGGQPEHNRYQLIGDELVTAWFVHDRRKGSPPTVEPGPDVTVVVYRRVRP
jgi:hypothetical protein